MSPKDGAGVALSVVAPCYNEALGLEAFVERMEAACRTAAGGPYEIILVNDGSKDATWATISRLCRLRIGVVGLNLSRNHGHQLAVSAGLAEARGRRVLVIDADLQDPPELLGEMMAKLDAGADVAFGRRRRRIGESRFKLLTADLFYRLLARLSAVPIPRDAGDFRLMSRRVVDRLNALPEQDRFLRGLVAWLGGRQDEVLYDRPARFAGKSAYGMVRMIKLAAAGVTSFSTAPLQIASLMAGFGAVFGCGIMVYVVLGFLTGRAVTGWTSLALLVTAFATAQFVCLAVLSAYVGRIFLEAKRRPLFLVDDVLRSGVDVGLAPPAALEEAQPLVRTAQHGYG